MKLYNSMTGRKEEFIPLDGKNVKMYACGITVYDLSHIGHARQAIAYAMVADYLRYRGYNVKYVRNYTDVDDKIIDRANKLGKDPLEFSREQIEETEKDMANLHITDADVKPKASENIENIIEFVQGLIDNGHAYAAENGDVYFNVRSFPGYGKLSHRKVDELLNGVRKDVEEGKHDPIDFALWKAAKPGEISWKSPWGEGRPGWHTECVVMINKLFKDGKIDIHGGGQDLKFPHHENEIAQSMAYNGHPIANYWMHNQMINIDGEKMSKSLGNVLWAKDLIVEFGCNVFKWLMLSTHYRNPLNMTDDVIAGVRKEVSKVENATKNASLYLQVNHVPAHDYKKETVDAMVNALEDDLNTSLALTQVLDQVKVLNQVMRVREKDNDVIATEYATLVKMGDVLGFLFEGTKLSEEDIALYEEWNAYKKEKNFDEADRVRKELTERGIL